MICAALTDNVTSPEVPPPDKPVPASTPVISPLPPPLAFCHDGTVPFDVRTCVLNSQFLFLLIYHVAIIHIAFSIRS